MSALSEFILPGVLALSAMLVTAAGGARLTQRRFWYYQLRKPHWEPPDWLFGPVWSAIFVL